MADLVVCVVMANTKPYVQVATVCERILQDEDKVISAIRLIDTLTIKAIYIPKPGNAPADAQPLAAVQLFDLYILVMLKAGDLVGDFRIALQMRDPKQQTVPLPVDSPVVLKGGDGVNVKFQFGLPHNAPEGPYWFDVLWNGDVLTSIPLTLKREVAQVEEGLPKAH